MCRGTERQEPGRIKTVHGLEAGEDRPECGSHARVEGGEKMRDIKFFNDLLIIVPF